MRVGLDDVLQLLLKLYLGGVDANGRVVDSPDGYSVGIRLLGSVPRAVGRQLCVDQLLRQRRPDQAAMAAPGRRRSSQLGAEARPSAVKSTATCSAAVYRHDQVRDIDVPDLCVAGVAYSKAIAQATAFRWTRAPAVNEPLGVAHCVCGPPGR